MTRFNVPPLTRALFLSLVLCTFLNALLVPDFRGFRPITRKGNGAPYLSLLPGTSYRFPWTFATASLTEQNIPGLVVTAAVVFWGGRYLERAYGSAEFAKFVLFSTVLPNVISFLFYWLLFALSRNESALTSTISGGISLQASFLVAFKQLVPEHVISVFGGALRLRVKHLPALFLAANTLSGLMLGTETALLLAWLGFFIAWIYLRFYRVSQGLGDFGGSSAGEGSAEITKGDASDTFAFAYFFPEPMQTLVAAVADRLWNLACAIGLCAPFSADDVESGNAHAFARAEGGNPITSRPLQVAGGARDARREEADRRRALALKALDERLQAAAAAKSAATESAHPVAAASANAPVTVAKAASETEQGTIPGS